MRIPIIFLMLFPFTFSSNAQVGLQSIQKDMHDVYLKLWTDNIFGSTMSFGLDFINANQVDFDGSPDVLKLQNDSDGNVTIGNTITSGKNQSDARLTVKSENDSNMDIRLEGNGRMSSPGNFEIYFDDDSNQTGYFRVFPQNSNTALFAICENFNHALLGDLTLSGNLASANYPDYVFDPSYRLTDLYDLKNRIRELGHLPEIPSAAEVKENGIPLADMTKRLLKKIEELTLYVIDLQEQIDAMK